MNDKELYTNMIVSADKTNAKTPVKIGKSFLGASYPIVSTAVIGGSLTTYLFVNIAAGNNIASWNTAGVFILVLVASFTSAVIFDINVPFIKKVNMKKVDKVLSLMGVDINDSFYKKKISTSLSLNYKKSRKENSTINSFDILFNQENGNNEEPLDFYKISFSTSLNDKNKKETVLEVQKCRLSSYVPDKNSILKQEMRNYENILLNATLEDKNKEDLRTKHAISYMEFAKKFDSYYSLEDPSEKETDTFTNYVKHCSSLFDSPGTNTTDKISPRDRMRLEGFDKFVSEKPNDQENSLDLILIKSSNRDIVKVGIER